MFFNYFYSYFYPSQSPKIIKENQEKVTKEDASNDDSKSIKLIINRIKTRIGCSYFQVRITKDHGYANKYLYPVLKSYMDALINDSFGNYLYQEFLNVLDDKNLDNFIKFIFDNFEKFAFSEHSSKVIQKMIENTSIYEHKEELIYQKLFEKIRGNVPMMSCDEQASHIIQKIVMYGGEKYNNYIYEENYNYLLFIATTKYGCCTIQRMLLYSNHYQRNILANLLLNYSSDLVLNQFGNYAYQTLVLLDEDLFTFRILQALSNNIYEYCKGVYSSNVIEKLFLTSNEKIKAQAAMIILRSESQILNLVCNQYGNYIVQRILLSVKNQMLINKVLLVIKKNVESISKKPFGKILLIKLRNQLSHLASNVQV